MKRLVGALLLLSLAMPALGYENEMVLLQVTPITYDGQAAWEYIYDIYGVPQCDFRIKDLDTTGVLNMYNGGFHDFWSAWTAGYPSYGPWFGYYNGPNPSYGDPDTNTWEIIPTVNDSNWIVDETYAAEHGMINTWHVPTDYAAADGASWWNGSPRSIANGDAFDGFYFGYCIGGPYNSTTLSATLRIVHTGAPTGTITYAPDGYAAMTVTGPGEGSLNPTGDFDADGDVDADDIDLLMANLGGDPAVYDLTDDGVVDQDDVDEWVFNIVPIGENIGTVYGDFNLDGEVNAGDLALLATNYGLVGTWGWATGDGNGDGNVDAGDLAMLATNYGTVVHPVPEPVTLSLLAVGGAVLLRRRSR
jgi:hypothetical protein